MLNSPAGGWDDRLFVDPVAEEHRCKICFMVAKDPYNIPYHIYCKGCFDRAQRPDNPITCPINQTQITGPLMVNMYVKSQIESMTIRCPNHITGCDAKFALGNGGINLVTHTMDCRYLQTA